MKSLAILVAATSLLLSGCATTLRSDVTVFHQWPAEVPDKSYVFEAPPAADDTLEYRNYQGVVAHQLAQLGFAPAERPEAAKLKVGMQFSTIDRPTRVLQASDPFMTMSPYWHPWGYSRYPYWGGRYRGYGYGYYRPFYDPWLYGPLEMREIIQHNYERQLRVTINSTTGQKLYDVTVQNTSRRQSTPEVMPALVQSAFTGFPGESGKAKRIELELK